MSPVQRDSTAGRAYLDLLQAREKGLLRDRTPSTKPKVLPPVSFGSRCWAFKKTTSYQPQMDDDHRKPLKYGQNLCPVRGIQDGHDAAHVDVVCRLRPACSRALAMEVIAWPPSTSSGCR
jgi:hypothetical protein